MDNRYPVKVLTGFCPKRGMIFVLDVKNKSRLLIFKGDENLPEYSDKEHEGEDFEVVRMEAGKAYRITIEEIAGAKDEQGRKPEAE